MTGTPQQNGIAERINHMLLDMVQCMLVSSLPLEFLWGEALKTAAYILNQMSYGHRRSLVFITSMFGGVAMWKSDRITRNLRNLIQKPLVGTLLVIVWDKEVPCFIARCTPPE